MIEMMRAVTAIVAVAALFLEAVFAQPAPRRVFVDVTRPSGAPEVDLRTEDFEITEGGQRREVLSAKMARRPARLVLVVDSTDHRPVFVVLTTEGFESTQNINPQQISHITDHFASRGGAFTNISPNGLLEVMERLAAVINQAYTSSPPVYQIEFAGALPKGKQPPAPQVRVLREGLRLSVISTP